jgi:hypothetical protein
MIHSIAPEESAMQQGLLQWVAPRATQRAVIPSLPVSFAPVAKRQCAGIAFAPVNDWFHSARHGKHIRTDVDADTYAA